MAEKKNISSLKDLQRELDKNTNLLIFSSDFKVEGKWRIENDQEASYPVHKLNFIKIEPGMFRIEKVRPPSMRSRMAMEILRNDKILAELCDRTIKGLKLVFLVNPRKQESLSFCQDILRMLDAKAYPDNEFEDMMERHEVLDSRLGAYWTNIPFAAGCSANSSGKELKYCGKADVLQWTLAWRPYAEQVEPEVLEEYPKHVMPDIHRATEEGLDPLANPHMFDPANAKDSDHVKFIDRDALGWPVAFGARFWRGAAYIVPDAVDIRSLIAKIDSLDKEFRRKHPKTPSPDNARSNLTEDIDPSRHDNTYSIEISFCNDAANAKKSTNHKKFHCKLFVNGKAYISQKSPPPPASVPAEKLIQFMAIWYHSMKGKGVMFCSDSSWDKYIKGKQDFQKFMALDAADGKMGLGLADIFDNKPDKMEPSQYLERIVSAAVFHHQQPLNTNENNIMAYILKKRLWRDHNCDEIKYSVRQLVLGIKASKEVLASIGKHIMKDRPSGKKFLDELSAMIEM